MTPGNTKYVLILNGGGLKGAFQAGVLNYLQDNWKRITGNNQLRFDIISGCSAGALNGSFMAMNKLHELNTFWDSVAEKGVEAILNGPLLTLQNGHADAEALEKQLFGDAPAGPGVTETFRLLLSKARRQKFLHHTISRLTDKARYQLTHLTALAGYEPLLAKLERYVRLDDITPGTRLFTGLSSLHDGQFYHLEHTDFADNTSFIMAVLAATLPPVVCEPVELVHTRRQPVYQCADGCLTNTAPIGQVLPYIHAGGEASYRLIIINSNTSTHEAGARRGHYALDGRTLQMTNEITAAGIFRKDLAAFKRYNSMALHHQAEALSPLQVRSNGQIRPVKAFAHVVIQAPPMPAAAQVGQQILAGWQQAEAVFGVDKSSFFEFTPEHPAA